MFEQGRDGPATGPARLAVGLLAPELCALTEEEEALVSQALAELDAVDPVTLAGLGVEVAAGVEVGAEALTALADLAPGAELAARVAALDPATVDDMTCVDLIDAAARLGAWAEAVSVAAIAGLCQARPPRPVEPGRTRWAETPATIGVSEYVIEEVAAALCLSRTAATDRVLTALDLTRRLPTVLAALHAGTITSGRARVFAEQTRTLSPDDAARVADALLPSAATRSLSQLRHRLTTEVLAADPAAAAARASAATRAHRVLLRNEGDGLASITTYATAAEAAAVFTVLDLRANADTSPGDPRGVDERRAHALIDLILTHPWITGDPTGTTSPARSSVLVQLTVPALTLMGVTDLPGVIAGFGPVDADTARQIAANTTWVRILTDPLTGAVLDVGTTRYTPTPAIRRHVQATHPTCRGIGCQVPAHRCDLDHNQTYPHGPTAEHNLGPFCRGHHISKTHSLITLTRDGDTFIWTMPTGHTYRREPDTIGPTLEQITRWAGLNAHLITDQPPPDHPDNPPPPPDPQQD